MLVMLMGTVQKIKLDSSSLSGYERKYEALLGLGHHDDAIAGFQMMLSKMLESADPEIRGEANHIVPIYFH